MRHVILGAGPAGLAALASIRRNDAGARITLVSGEPGLPYSRMALPYYVNGDLPSRHLYPHPALWYRQPGVELRWGEPGEALDVERREVTLAGGERLPFDRLLVATGSRAQLREAPGIHLPQVQLLWTLGDARRLRRRANGASEVVIWGAGMIAFMTAKALLTAGRRVHFICRAEYLLRRSLDQEAAFLLEGALEQAGAVLHRGLNLAEIRSGPGRRCRVLLTDGSELPADLVVVALGVAPNLDWLDDAPVQRRQGLLVNERLETSAAGIFAAGDVAEVRDCVTGESGVPALWSVATDQGRVAGLNMTGATLVCDPALRSNTMVFHDYVVATLGCPLVRENTRVYRRLDRERRVYRCLVLSGGRLVGAILAGDVSQVGFLRSVIRRGAVLTDPEGLLGTPPLPGGVRP